MWRFYAGFFFASVLGLSIISFYRIKEKRDSWQMWGLLFFTIMLLFGAATHSIVKYRPMHSMPFLGYQVWVNVIGVIGIVGILSDLLVARVPEKYKLFVLGLVWSYFIYVGLAVRQALGVYLATMNMGRYPDPGQRLYELFNNFRFLN